MTADKARNIPEKVVKWSTVPPPPTKTTEENTMRKGMKLSPEAQE
jgi:hypothetical protein